MKKRILIGVGALVLAAAPAALGLWGNSSFAESVPVPVPASGEVIGASPSPTADDHGGATPRDDRVEPGDDRGGATPRDDRTEPGDDRGGATPRDDRAESGDDRGGVSGGTDDSGRGHGGSDDGGGEDDD